MWRHVKSQSPESDTVRARHAAAKILSGPRPPGPPAPELPRKGKKSAMTKGGLHHGAKDIFLFWHFFYRPQMMIGSAKSGEITHAEPAALFLTS
jgi:hypothetical protein